MLPKHCTELTGIIMESLEESNRIVGKIEVDLRILDNPSMGNHAKRKILIELALGVFAPIQCGYQSEDIYDNLIGELTANGIYLQEKDFAMFVPKVEVLFDMLKVKPHQNIYFSNWSAPITVDDFRCIIIIAEGLDA